MLFARIPLLLALIHLSSAAQPSSPAPIPAPLRKLPWGQLNFLHTTDTHGWHGGHLQEAQYGADWGDYISFAHHLRKRADDDGSDLLLIDTGDRVEGNGLYDASNPKGEYTFDILKHQRIDVITSGNHELYKRNSSINEYDKTVPDFKDSYISSNLDIQNPKTGELEPLAPKYRKFTTKNQGIRILAFGFLFNFHGNANNTVVQNVQDTIKEQWFQDAIRQRDVDLFLVTGHVPVRNSPEYDAVYKAIRNAQWDTPIVFFGGHTHIRDYKKWESKAQGIESGRYMETLGFLSISGLSTGKKDQMEAARASPTYQRLYIDNNLYSLQQHSATNDSTFSTELGRNVTKAIASARKKLNLDHAYGCAPKDYWLNRAPYPSNDSLLTWLEKKVLPNTFNDTKAPTIVITNSGAMRFDIFKGPFTIDTTFLVSPFTSGFRMLEDVPYIAASQVLRLLNNEGPIPLKDLVAFAGESETMEGFQVNDLIPHLPLANHQTPHRHGSPARLSNQIPLDASDDDDDRDLVPGYTTKDDLGSDGDDTVHRPIDFYDVPNCIGANIGFDPREFRSSAVPDTVDLVYNEFIQDWVILALRYLGVKYDKEESTAPLGETHFTGLISGWVHDHWKC